MIGLQEPCLTTLTVVSMWWSLVVYLHEFNLFTFSFTNVKCVAYTWPNTPWIPYPLPFRLFAHHFRVGRPNRAYSYASRKRGWKTQLRTSSDALHFGNLHVLVPVALGQPSYPIDNTYSTFRAVDTIRLLFDMWHHSFKFQAICTNSFRPDLP